MLMNYRGFSPYPKPIIDYNLRTAIDILSERVSRVDPSTSVKLSQAILNLINALAVLDNISQ